MNVRDRAEEVGAKIRSGNPDYISSDLKAEGTALTKDNFDDGKSLFDWISSEELAACTTCNACVEACPVLINPLEPILEMRRYEILTQAAGPKDWAPMFTSMENSGSVWQMPNDRDEWAKEV
jgi:Fe-S oxidoreductase